MSVDHYENFPVASVLCPPALRPAIQALYGFARTADDLADEGDASPAQRAQDLGAYRQDLRAIARGQPPSARWAPVFVPLADILRRHHLPLPLLEALLDAFEQDLHQSRYADRAELLRYCERSANPVGRLLLHLYGVSDALSLAQSDEICSALQLINFWQDCSRDHPRGRIYLPRSDWTRFQVSEEMLLAGRDTPETRALIADEVAWARAMMLDGAPLALRLPGRTGWELRLVVQGGLRILDKIEAMGCATLAARPKIGAWDAPGLLWRAARMRQAKLRQSPP